MHAVAGGFDKAVNKEFVDTQQCLSLVGYEAEMFIHPVFRSALGINYIKFIQAVAL